MYGKYGLLERSIRVNVDYEKPDGSKSADWLPVFTVGRVQLCEFFGLKGYERSRDINFHSTLDYSDFPNARYALVSLGGEWSDGYVEKSRMVGLYDVFETFEQVVYHAGSCLELDALNASKFSDSYLVYHYEIWQICDDDSLWHDWDMDSACYWNGECYDNWLAEVSDGPHFYPTVVHKPVLMSEDYLSSLKTYNEDVLESLRQLREASSLDDDGCDVSRIEKLERCAACGERLSKPYQFFIDGHGLVCHRCWQWYTHWGINVFDSQTLADRLHRAALYDGFEDDPDWEDVEAADAAEVC